MKTLSRTLNISIESGKNKLNRLDDVINEDLQYFFEFSKLSTLKKIAILFTLIQSILIKLNFVS
jgi:hypothetical protein